MRYLDDADVLNSQPFTVKDKPVQIRVFGLEDGEELCLYLFDGGDCNTDPCSEPTVDNCGNAICMCCGNSNIFVEIPGDYILVKNSNFSVDRIQRREVSRGMIK